MEREIGSRSDEWPTEINAAVHGGTASFLAANALDPREKISLVWCDEGK